MIRRVFLGWDEPFLRPAAKWLLGLGPSLAETWILVPTGQAGRTLAEAMTRDAGALLAPRITTPGAWMSNQPDGVAADWIECLAWMEVFAALDDWDCVSAAFPVSASDEPSYLSLAREMTSLRRTLQEAGLTLQTAAKAMEDSIEADRWSALARLEDRVELQLQAWQLRSRSQALADGLVLPTGVHRVVLAGITEMPGCVERAILGWDGEVCALIGAPESLAARFSRIGLPLECWARSPMPWPQEPQGGSVQVVADARSQASAAIDRIAQQSTQVEDLALGSADTATALELSRQLAAAGWPAFSPGNPLPEAGLTRWLRVWLHWLEAPSLQALADLLALPETSMLVSGDRSRLSYRLFRYRDRVAARDVQDVRLHLQCGDAWLRPQEIEDVREILVSVEPLLVWRDHLLGKEPARAMTELLNVLGGVDEGTVEQSAVLTGWWLSAMPWISSSARPVVFWLRLMLDSQPTPTPEPPAGRVIDVQGWLELFFESGSHLVICGLNEGNVPDSEDGNTWISEATARRLGLRSRDERAGRDAFLFQAMVEARKSRGRVDLLCAKTGQGGTPLLPSRLLLQCDGTELAQRVMRLFREVAPADVGVRPHWDWLWSPPPVEPPAHLPVTALRDYLTCPFRFCLTHLLRMRPAQPDRTEWNAADFGTISHAVLEAWGRDPMACQLDQEEPLSDWLSAQLDVLCSKRFAGLPPLGIRLQIESLRQRLTGFARQQAEIRRQGWETIAVETPLRFELEGVEIRATIDRIDRHPDGVVRVIDYKTGKVDSVEQAHRRMLRANSKIAEHLDLDSPVFLQNERGNLQWTNLQLPLYALAAMQQLDGSELPSPCYFVLGASGSSAELQPWDGFSQSDADSARACASWIVRQILERKFWPPSERVAFDPFAGLTGGNRIEQCFHAVSACGKA